MPIMRNPFRKQDENLRPSTAINGVEQKVNGTPTAKPIDIRAEKEPAEYKLSGVSRQPPTSLPARAHTDGYL